MATWFRVHSSILDNRKLQSLPPGLFKWTVNLWAAAARNNGILPPLEDIAWALHCPVAAVSRAVSQLIEKRFMEQVDGCFLPHDWSEHQYESDSSTERVRKHRERQKQRIRNVSRNDTGNVTETPSEAEQKQRQKSRAEQSRGAPEPAPPPLTPGELSEPAPDELAVLLVSELLARPHWTLSDRGLSIRAATEILARATSPRVQRDAIAESHAAHAEYHRRNPKGKKKPLQYWLKDEDFLVPTPAPVDALPVSAEGW